MGRLLVESKGWAIVNIDHAGLGDLGRFDTFDGADGTASTGKYKPAGMPEETYGGAASIDDITVTRGVDKDRDRPLIKSLYDALGHEAASRVDVQWLDKDENPYGNPISYTGILKGVKVPKFDSQGGDNITMLELTFEVNATVSA